MSFAAIGPVIGSILEVLLITVGGLFALAALYLAVLAVAALFRREPPEDDTAPTSRLVILVPAYNEADLIARCVASLLDQTYPKDRYDVVVIADNCTDTTALIAEAAGATVMVRDRPDSRGKGQALRWAMDKVLAAPVPPDAIGVVDADSVAEPDLLVGLARALERGADAVQAEYLVLPEEDSAGAVLRAAAILLFHRVRFGGRAALGLPCTLVGNGMLFSRSLLERFPWNAFSGAEDLEYSIDLRLAGVRPVFAGTALLRGPVPTSGRAADVQRQRWEGGRLHVVRTRLPQLLRASLRRGSLVDAAVDLAVPPLGLLALAGLGGTALTALLAATDVVSWWTVVPWVVSLVGVAVFVFVGLRAARAPASMYRALVMAPLFLVRKAFGTVRVLKKSRGDTWVRTERPSERGSRQQRREIGGVPIDWIEIDEALTRITDAAKARSFVQVSTVNLDFLTNAQRDPEARTILTGSGLSLPDGAPIVWLGWLRGTRPRGRVAGADLVPRLVERAAAEGLPVFFLGGENGAARTAADRLLAQHPGLQVSVYEPPRAALEDMDDDEIFRRLGEAQPAILLVAFGHPKQEKWIHRHGDRLPMVSMGVGCSFDLIAGQRGRAPMWMQHGGLEWAYRVVHEPVRLTRRYVTDGLWLLVVFFPTTLYQRLLRRP